MTRILSLIALGIACASLVVVIRERQATRANPLGSLFLELFPTPRAGDVLLAAAAGAVLVVAPLVVADLTGGAHAKYTEPSSWLAWPILALASVVVAIVLAGMEELMFRGAVLPIIHRRIPLWAAVFASSAMFAVAHLERQGAQAPTWVTLADLTLDGIGFAIAFLATGTLWVPVAMHAAKNLAVWLLVGGFFGFVPPLLQVTTTAPSWYGDTGQAGSLDVLVTVAVVAVLTLLWRQRPRARP